MQQVCGSVENIDQNHSLEEHTQNFLQIISDPEQDWIRIGTRCIKIQDISSWDVLSISPDDTPCDCIDIYSITRYIV